MGNCGATTVAFLAALVFQRGASQSSCTAAGSLRLVGGSTQYEGRVEICQGSRWGTVCDDYWGNLNARVVCRQLGYSTSGSVAFSRARFGQGSGSIYLDDVQCTGTETTLLRCRHSSHHNCGGHYEDASVRCLPLTTGPVSSKLLAAIKQVESGGDENAVGDGGKAIGPFQIWKRYWLDAAERDSSLTADGKGYENCKGNGSTEYSERVVQAYMSRYATRARLGHDPTDEDIARIHNGGPNGYKNPATEGYWEKVKKAMKSIANTQV